MEPELTREEAQSIYDQARFLFNQGAAIGDAWSRAMAADHITLEFAPASIRRALALEAGEAKAVNMVTFSLDGRRGDVYFWRDAAEVAEAKLAAVIAAAKEEA